MVKYSRSNFITPIPPAASVDETSVYRLLRAHDLINSPAFIVMKAANEFKLSRMYQTGTIYRWSPVPSRQAGEWKRPPRFRPTKGEAIMTFNDSADSKQLSILATVVDDYCRQAGIAVGDPARERLGRQIIELFQSGMDQPDELLLALNHHYDEWLGEVGLPSSCANQAASLISGAAPSPADHPSMSPQRFPQRKTPQERGF